MDSLNKWFADLSESPVGSIVLFVGVFLTRVVIDEVMRKRDTKRKHKHKRKVAHDG